MPLKLADRQSKCLELTRNPRQPLPHNQCGVLWRSTKCKPTAVILLAPGAVLDSVFHLFSFSASVATSAPSPFVLLATGISGDPRLLPADFNFMLFDLSFCAFFSTITLCPRGCKGSTKSVGRPSSCAAQERIPYKSSSSYRSKLAVRSVKKAGENIIGM